MIDIEYFNGEKGRIANSKLQELIENKRVIKFKRESGWVTIGVDPIRQYRRIVGNFAHYTPERTNETNN